MPLKQSRKRANTTRELIYDDFSGGLNYRDNPSLIKPSQTPECQNVRVRDGTISKRPGFKRLYTTSLGIGRINGVSPFIKANGTKYRLIAWGTNLYTQSGTSQPVLISSILANAKTTFFVLSDVCYIKDGVNYFSYDGTTFSTVVGYIPTILVGRSPSGSPNAGTVTAKLNLISASFATSFSADGTATVYSLTYGILDATLVTAVVNGVNKVETTDFTVNRTTGAITFLVAPVAGTDNVIITAYKASLTHPEYINNCTIATVFGGKTSTTVFFSGNPNFPDQVWHSRLYESNYSANYWPDDAWQKIPGNVVGLSHIYDLLYVSHTKGHGYLSYIDGVTYPSFSYSDINLEQGTDAPGSIQQVDNTIVGFSSQWGVTQIISNTTLNNRLSVTPISDLINYGGIDRLDLGLLRQVNPTMAISYNFDGYYGLCINNVCYVWDYKTNTWLYDINIPASCFATIDNTLCFGSNTDGLVFQFDPTLVNDDGTAINAWYNTRKDSAGTPNWIKVINHLDLVAKPLMRGSAVLAFISRQSNGIIALTTQTSAFAYSGFSYVNFTCSTSFFPVVKRKRILKRANYFQFKFSNNVLDEGMSIISLRVEFDQGSEMR